MHRILLVDDEPDILDSLCETLPTVLRDCRVECVQSAPEAIRRIEEGPEPFDLVVSDERMPDMSGLEFLTWLRRNHPDTLRVLMTAYPDPALRRRAEAEAGVRLFLAKPFALGGVASALAGLLRKDIRET